MIEPFSFSKACVTVIDIEDDDPRPAVLLETVWARIRDVGLSDTDQITLVNELAGAVLLHYGYRPGFGRQEADARVTAAVRMARLPESMGCRWCGAERDGHGTRFVPGWPGQHEWTEPTEDQRQLRIRALTVDLEMEYSR